MLWVGESLIVVREHSLEIDVGVEGLLEGVRVSVLFCHCYDGKK